jgi:hypothetical protein
LVLEFLGFIRNCVLMIVARTYSDQERVLPAEIYGLSVPYGGGGRIRTHVARQGGRFTVCSD